MRNRFPRKTLCKQIQLLCSRGSSHLIVDACSQTPHKVMKAQHGGQIPRKPYPTCEKKSSWIKLVS